MDLLEQSIRRAKIARHAPVAIPSMSPKTIAIQERDMEIAREQILNLEVKISIQEAHIEVLEAQIVKLKEVPRAVNVIPLRRPSDRPHIGRILAAVALEYGISVDEIRGPWRSKFYMEPRWVAIWIARKRTLHSFPSIGEYIGGRDHTTCIHAYRKIEERLAMELAADDDTLAERIARIDVALGLKIA